MTPAESEDALSRKQKKKMKARQKRRSNKDDPEQRADEGEGEDDEDDRTEEASAPSATTTPPPPPAPSNGGDETASSIATDDDDDETKAAAAATTPAPRTNFDVDFVDYVDESQLAPIMALVDRDLSEPYSIFTYRYFVHNWPEVGCSPRPLAVDSNSTRPRARLRAARFIAMTTTRTADRAPTRLPPCARHAPLSPTASPLPLPPPPPRARVPPPPLTRALSSACWRSRATRKS